ncbi:MAG: HDOD domain-containing protein [Nitrospiraceae bacterium]
MLSTQVFSQFDRAQLPSFSLDALWQHAMVAGGYARSLAKEEGVDQPVVEAAYTAALLHDLGRLVLAANRPGVCAGHELGTNPA